MEQSRKYLKLSSIAVLALALFSMLQLVSELLFGDMNQAVIPEGAPDNILLITRIILYLQILQRCLKSQELLFSSRKR